MSRSEKNKDSVGQLNKLLEVTLKKVDQEIIYRLDKSIPLN